MASCSASFQTISWQRRGRTTAYIANNAPLTIALPGRRAGVRQPDPTRFRPTECHGQACFDARTTSRDAGFHGEAQAQLQGR